MYFYEVIERCDLELVVREFLTFCEKAPDRKATEQKIRNVIMNLSRMEPIISDTGILYAERAEDEEYDAVCLFDTLEKEIYSVEANPWAKTIGYIADEKSLSIYGNEKFAALVLWEMTWFGYDEEAISKEIKSWEEFI